MLHYTIPESDFKKLGYTFTMLYAANYKAYYKEISALYTIWCFVKGKTIEVSDWGASTEDVIRVAEENMEELNKKGRIILHLNMDNGEVTVRDEVEYIKAMVTDDDDYFKRMSRMWTIRLSKDDLYKITKEVNILTQRN